MKRFAGAAFIAALLVSTSVSANDTMSVLTAGSQLQIVTPTGVTVVITFDGNGTYQTNSGSSGTWTITGDELCTVRDADGTASCGNLPSGKILGDSWETVDGNGNTVTASII